MWNSTCACSGQRKMDFFHNVRRCGILVFGHIYTAVFYEGSEKDETRKDYIYSYIYIPWCKIIAWCMVREALESIW